MNFATTTFSLLIACSVFLSGIHAKELPVLQRESAHRSETSINKSSKDDQGSSPHGKVSGEAHNHIDKLSLKTALKVYSDQNFQADAKHLKRHRHHSRRAPAPRRLSGVLGIFSRSFSQSGLTA